ncbi:MAG: DegV family protein [Blautia wexlerae]
MGKIAIVTDSNSGITQDQARELGISVIPMPFYINEKLYLEGITLSQEEFYERLKSDEVILTSQPGPADSMCSGLHTYWKSSDEVVHRPNVRAGLDAHPAIQLMGLAQECDG